MRPPKTRIEDFDPNASDPNDSDFEENPSSPPRRSSKKKKSTPARKKTSKRQRRTYRDSQDDDIVDSDEEISEASYASPDIDVEEEPETNPRTGRAVRNAAKKQIKYEESAEEDIEDDLLVVESTEKNLGDKRKQRKSLIAVLKVKFVPQEQKTRSTRARSTRAGSSKTVQPEPNVRTRRSARLSEDRDEPLQELGYTAKARSVRSATGSHSPQRRLGTRPAQGRKAPMKRPSTIMENSQEGSGPSAHSPDPLQPKEEEEAQEEIQVSQAASVTSQTHPEAETIEDAQTGEVVIEESEHEPAAQDEQEEDSDEGPVTRGRTRGQRVGQQIFTSSQDLSENPATPGTVATSPSHSPSATASSSGSDKFKIYIPLSHRVGERELRALTADSQLHQPDRTATGGSQKRRADSSDFTPDDDDKPDDDDDDDDAQSQVPPRKRQKSSTEESTTRRKSTRLKGSGRSRRNSASDDDDQLDADELADEAAELAYDERRNRRTRNHHRAGEVSFEHKPTLRTRKDNTNYQQKSLQEVLAQDEREQEEAASGTPSQKRGPRATGWRPLFSVQGPFGGLGGGNPLLGIPTYEDDTGGQSYFNNYPGGPTNRREPLGEPDSDSSDDETNQSGQRGPHAAGGLIPKEPHPNLGKINEKKSNADIAPITVDESINFDNVGGLDNHVNQLKEMVSLPLLYPEIFLKFKITPPRGVLFHGPPGTGKTLLARALANAVSTNGKKVTFYMRKGADALSKWVGEAERQLRMLFEEARKNQPSIIFFDEIDGLAPVRSSKSDQIHSSIVATLLALMDGMDDRGQVVIIGATNRPDNVDPALRRPGRFDREFYFPLPSLEARRSIVEIHTKNWDPPLTDDFKNHLAELTKGYGGADLRALCTEAAVNAVQGTFPQIYQSTKKLLIDTSKIKVSAKDFMISVNKMVPSSERTSSTGAAPLGQSTAPLLKPQFEEIARMVDEVIPSKKRLTALEEAQFDDRDDAFGFERENVKRNFEQAKTFRPRLLIRGYQGMGQQEISAALLHRFENIHVQSFDLPTLLGESQTPEATLVQLFKEVRRHKPSVIFIPHVDVWYLTVGPPVINIFTSLLRTMPANEPVLVLGTMEQQDEDDKPDPGMLKDLFGYSAKNQYELKRPDETARTEYFENVIAYIRKSPKDFPETTRKKRRFEELEEAPEPEVVQKQPSKDELKAIKKADRHTLNMLKLSIQPIMDQLRKYKIFLKSAVADHQIQYLYAEENPQVLTSDLPLEQRQHEHRPFELAYDHKGVKGLLETETGRFYYNLNIPGIEERLANGYYKRPVDFLEDIKAIAKDAKHSGDAQKILKANEMVTNVEVDITHIEEVTRPDLKEACEAVYRREQERLKALQEEVEKQAAQNGQEVTEVLANVPPDHGGSLVASESTGPVVLGAGNPSVQHMPPLIPSHPIGSSSLSNGISTSDKTDSNHRHSNGSAGYGEDSTHLDGSQDQDSQHRDKRQKLVEGTQQSASNTQAVNRSQRSGHTQMAPNTHPGDYHNSASTTTSGQKTSDHSSGQFSNTQSTVNGNAPVQHPDFASGPAQSGGSQIPDTQEPLGSSQLSNSQQSQSSQPHHAAPPLALIRQEPKVGSLLNVDDEQPEPQLIVDEDQLTDFHAELVRRSSGLSVEQLEQVNSAIMATLWKERGDWNRSRVLHSAKAAFNETIDDIEHMQKVFPPSQEKQNKP